MLIYHGSNTIVENPEIRNPNRNLDFGIGFYTTMNIEQAKSFSRIICNRRGGSPVISIFDFDYDSAKTSLKIKEFKSADEEWFDFVCNKRMGRDLSSKEEYDIIIGPVANDTVYLTFTGFLAGATSREDALKQLKARELYNQITFCNQKSLEFLKFKESHHG